MTSPGASFLRHRPRIQHLSPTLFYRPRTSRPRRRLPPSPLRSSNLAPQLATLLLLSSLGERRMDTLHRRAPFLERQHVHRAVGRALGDGLLNSAAVQTPASNSPAAAAAASTANSPVVVAPPASSNTGTTVSAPLRRREDQSGARPPGATRGMLRRVLRRREGLSRIGAFFGRERLLCWSTMSDCVLPSLRVRLGDGPARRGGACLGRVNGSARPRPLIKEVSLERDTPDSLRRRRAEQKHVYGWTSDSIADLSIIVYSRSGRLVKHGCRPSFRLGHFRDDERDQCSG